MTVAMTDIQNASHEAIDARTGELLGRPHIYSRFDLPRVSGLLCGNQSYVQPQFKDECEITNILHKFSVTGELPVSKRPATYGDVSEVPDFQSMMNLRNEMQAAFESLAPEVKAEFDDYADFAAFCAEADQEEIADVFGLSTSPHGGQQSETNQNSEASQAVPVDPVVKQEASTSTQPLDKAD